MTNSLRNRVQRLISLAIDVGTNEHEARNAALQACRLIAEHKLLETPVTQTARPEGSAFAEFLKDLFGAQVSFAHAAASEARRRAGSARAETVLIQMPANCAGCGRPLPVGTAGTWCRGELWHAGCWTRATAGDEHAKDVSERKRGQTP